MSLFQVFQVALAILAAGSAILHQKLPRLLGFILMGVGGVAMIIAALIGMKMANEAPYLLPLGIACVIGAIIAAIAASTSSPSLGDDNAGRTTERLPGWATAVIGGLILIALLVGGAFWGLVPHQK